MEHRLTTCHALGPAYLSVRNSFFFVHLCQYLTYVQVYRAGARGAGCTGLVRLQLSTTSVLIRSTYTYAVLLECTLCSSAPGVGYMIIMYCVRFFVILSIDIAKYLLVICVRGRHRPNPSQLGREVSAQCMRRAVPVRLG